MSAQDDSPCKAEGNKLVDSRIRATAELEKRYCRLFVATMSASPPSANHVEVLVKFKI